MTKEKAEIFSMFHTQEKSSSHLCLKALLTFTYKDVSSKLLTHPLITVCMLVTWDYSTYFSDQNLLMMKRRSLHLRTSCITLFKYFVILQNESGNQRVSAFKWFHKHMGRNVLSSELWNLTTVITLINMSRKLQLRLQWALGKSTQGFAACHLFANCTHLYCETKLNKNTLSNLMLGACTNFEMKEVLWDL